MKVKVIKDFKINNHWIRKDEVLTVRLFSDALFDLKPRVQMIDGSHSGYFIPRENFIEIKEEVSYSEKEWNDMENHYMEKINKLEYEIRKKQIATLPTEVFEAFNRLEKSWKQLLDKETMELLLLTLVSIPNVDGDASVLKKYAAENPTMYMRAILHGYTVSDEDMQKEQIRRWYKGALIRELDGIDPDGFAKEAIEEVVFYLGGAEILADLSPFCKNQLSKN